MLTDEQLKIIKDDIDNSGLTMQSLKDDLLDHFCCFIEDEMKRGLSFKDAYRKAYNQIAPNGLKEIQHETIFLLNTKKINMMKMITYAIGLLSAMSITISFLFKIQHWPGANVLHLYGLLGGFFLFLPLLVVIQYKNFFSKVMSEKLRVILGLASAVVVGAGIAVKMHHNGQVGDIILLAGFLIFTFGFLPALFFRMYKRSIE